MAAGDALARGDISRAQWEALSDKANETYHALDAHDADTHFGGYQGYPAADTHMPIDTSWWDADGYYHPS